MDIKIALIKSANQLKKRKLLRGSAHLDAELLLSFVLKRPKEWLFAHSDEELSIEQKKIFFVLTKRRSNFEPIAHITGKKEFFNYEFKVNKNVLIPRPKTESLLESALEYIFKLIAEKRNLTIADVGTGSGCLAISLAKELKKFQLKAKILAIDISQKALDVACLNAKNHGVKINFLKGVLLKPIKNKKIDIIVANLPYLEKKDFTEYKKILLREPRKALLAKNNGLEYYLKMFKQINEYKLYPFAVFCENLPRQTKTLKKIIKKFLPNYEIKAGNSITSATKP